TRTMFYSCLGIKPSIFKSVVENITKTDSSKDKNGWYHDWDEGIAAAVEEKKPLLVDFYTDWCKWCKVMDEETFSDSEVEKILTSNWVTIKINAEDRNSSGTFKDQTLPYNRLALAFGVNAFPSYLFIDKDGEPVTVVSGYRPKEQFVPVLDYFINELYKKGIYLDKYIESNS
ncbi:unnamed protein product, partial [marine sediment metagenome]